MAIQKQYLDGEYARKNASFHVEDSPWKAAQIIKALQRNSITPKTVAEVGCGAGEILMQLSTLLPSAELTGFELNPDGFKRCLERQSSRTRYFQEDLCAREEVYDAVLCIDVFEHIEDYFSFLRKLKSRGRHFVFHIPLDMNVQMVWRAEPIMRVRQQVGHLHYFSKDTALASLRDCGYELVDCFFAPAGIDRPGSGKARLLQWPRKLAGMMSEEWAARVLGGYSLVVVAR